MALGNGAEMRNVMALTSKQRAYLGGCASTMDPIFHIGKAITNPFAPSKSTTPRFGCNVVK